MAFLLIFIAIQLDRSWFVHIIRPCSTSFSNLTKDAIVRNPSELHLGSFSWIRSSSKLGKDKRRWIFRRVHWRNGCRARATNNHILLLMHRNRIRHMHIIHHIIQVRSMNLTSIWKKCTRYYRCVHFIAENQWVWNSQ